MALTFNNFSGFETQGLEEASATNNTPVADTTAPVRSGNASLKCDGTGAAPDYTIDIAVTGAASAGNKHIVGFAFQTDTKPPTVNATFCSAIGSSGSFHWRLQLLTNGDVRIVDANSSTVDTETDPLTVDTWHYFEVVWDDLDSGNIEVFLDDSSILSGSGDFKPGTETATSYRFTGITATGEDVAFDDFYCLTGAAASDRLGDGEVFMYQNTVEDATDQGNTLDSGTWAECGETPAVEEADGVAAEYAGTLSGYTICDEGDRPGPNGDANVDGDSNIKIGKWIWNLRRQNGSGTAHHTEHGNSADGVVDNAVTLSTSYQIFERASVAAAELPLSTETFAIGFGKDSGGRDILCAEQWAMLLHVPDAAAARPSALIAMLHQRRFAQVP